MLLRWRRLKPTLLRGVGRFSWLRGFWCSAQLLLLWRRLRLRAHWARDEVDHGDVRGGGWGGALGLWRVEVAAAFFEDVDEELLDAAGVFGSLAVTEFVNDAVEGARDFVFVEAGAAHGVADADARRRRVRGAGSR